MLWTVQNLTTRVLNDLDVFSFGSGTNSIIARGGQRKDPIPYPFGHVVFAKLGDPGDAKTLPVRPRDMAQREPFNSPLRPSEEWSGLVQGGVVSIVMTAEALPTAPPGGLRDPEEILFKTV